MPNPSPRPALRKAPDAHINPALPNGNQIDLRHRPAVTEPKPAPEVTVRTVAVKSAENSGSKDTKKDKPSKKHRKKVKRKLDQSAKARRKLRASKSK